MRAQTLVFLGVWRSGRKLPKNSKSKHLPKLTIDEIQIFHLSELKDFYDGWRRGREVIDRSRIFLVELKDIFGGWCVRH